MSGGIFKPSEEPLVEHAEESAETRPRAPPLLCPLCNEEYQDPRILQCYHSFCARCLRGRANNDLMNCPLCGSSTKVQEDTLPPSDNVLKFLVQSDEASRTPCANCDAEGSSMFFCTTCTQPLCETCRRETHRARMFSSHQFVPLSHHCRTQQQVCSKHSETFIMFSLTTHQLLCINCFKELDNESRSTCVDLDEAYNRGCQNLEDATQSLRELQTGVQDGIWLLRGLLDELKQNSDQEKTSVQELYSALHDQLSLKQEELMKQIISQQLDKEREFKEQLCSLSSLLPAIHTHMVTSTSFASEASKFEFLEQGYTLIDRLNAIASMQHPLQPQKSGQIDINAKLGFAKCMEELLDLKLYSQATSPKKRPVQNLIPYDIRSTSNSSERCSVPREGTADSRTSCCTCKSGATHRHSEGGNRKTNGYTGKIIIVEAGGTFAEHCKEFEATHREILQKFDCVKLQVQELQRDITQRKCMAKKAMVFDLKGLCSTMDNLIKEHSDSIGDQGTRLDKHWDETYQRVSDEQEIYKGQVGDAMRIKTESDRLKKMLKHMAPFIKSINSLCQNISPKLGETTKNSEPGETMTTILHQINALEPDSQIRVDAIHKTEEEREHAAATRVDPMVKELMKTKEILKSPGSRKTHGINRGGSFDSIVKPKVAEIMMGSPATSPVGKGPEAIIIKPPSISEPADAADVISLTTLGSPTEATSPLIAGKSGESEPHPAVKKTQSLPPLRGSKKRHANRGDSLGGKKDGVSLRELLHDEIVSWGEQRERQRETTSVTEDA